MKSVRDRGRECSVPEPAPGERPAARRGARPALALLLSTGATAAFLSFGGVGYAVDAVSTAVGGTGAQTAADDQYGGQCVEYVNPHGKVIPPAGLTPPGTNPNGGENPDGFYLIGDTGNQSSVFVTDLGSGTTFGPYPAGTVIKYTQAPGKTPSEQKIGSDTGQAGAVTVHITGTGDFSITQQGSSTQTCLVPPPPK
jgi:hypothetical protein